MSKTFRTLIERVGPDCPEQVGPVDDVDINRFVAAWRAAMQKFFGSDFDLSTHFLKDRLNHSRNGKQISTCEMTFVFNKFFKKFQQQFKQDVEDVKNYVAKPRGKNKQNLPKNELEYVISSQSTKINIVFALKQIKGKKGTAVIRPVTIMRKPKWNVTQGISVMVEDVEYDAENVYIVE